MKNNPTAALIVEAAREVFAQRGFKAASVIELSRAAGVTTGALYHHFTDKETLFRRVSYEVAQAVTLRSAAAMAENVEKGPWEAFLAGIRSVLESCCRPEVRVVYNEAHVVFGLAEWQKMEAEASGQLFEGAVAGLLEAGILAPAPLEVLTRTLRGAIVQAAMAITESADPPAAHRAACEILEKMLNGLRGQG